MQTTNSGSSTMQGTKDAMKDYASSAHPYPGSDAKLADIASKAASDVSKAASDVASHAAHSVRSLVDEGRAVATERFDATSRWVGDVTRENPMRTIGVAAAVGVIIGMLIGRR